MINSDVEFYCYFAYLGPFWFIGLMSDRRDSPKLKFHLNQGLVLFIAEVAVFIAVYFIGKLLNLIPYVGQYISWALWIAAVGCAFWLAVKGMLNVAADTRTQLPVIGRINLLR